MRTEARKRKLRALLAEHPARDNPAFVELYVGFADSRPNETPEGVLQSASYVWELTQTLRAQMEEHARALIMAERERILEIVEACQSRDDLMPALQIALTSDHAPNVVAAMIERQRAQSLS